MAPNNDRTVSRRKPEPDMTKPKDSRTQGAGAAPATPNLRLPEVEALTGRRRSAIYQDIADGRFPAPSRLGAAPSAGSRPRSPCGSSSASRSETGSAPPLKRQRRCSDDRFTSEPTLPGLADDEIFWALVRRDQGRSLWRRLYLKQLSTPTGLAARSTGAPGQEKESKWICASSPAPATSRSPT